MKWSKNRVSKKLYAATLLAKFKLSNFENFENLFIVYNLKV